MKHSEAVLRSLALITQGTTRAAGDHELAPTGIEIDELSHDDARAVLKAMSGWAHAFLVAASSAAGVSPLEMLQEVALIEATHAHELDEVDDVDE